MVGTLLRERHFSQAKEKANDVVEIDAEDEPRSRN
jgi:hypothetical protein